MTSPCTIPWQTESTDDIKDNRAHDLLSIGGITSAIRASLEADDSQWQINVLPYVTRLLNTSSLVNDNHVVVADDSNDCSARKMMVQDRITCMEVLEDVTVSHSQAEVVDEIFSAVESVFSKFRSTDRRLSQLLQGYDCYSSTSISGGDRKFSSIHSMNHEIRMLQEILELLGNNKCFDKDESDDAVIDLDTLATKANKKKRKLDDDYEGSKSSNKSFTVWERNVRKILHDLMDLVLSSLLLDQHHHDHSNEIKKHVPLHLKIDSPLLDAIDEEYCHNLFIIPLIMYFSPILKYRHVAVSQ